MYDTPDSCEVVLKQEWSRLKNAERKRFVDQADSGNLNNLQECVLCKETLKNNVEDWVSCDLCDFWFHVFA